GVCAAAVVGSHAVKQGSTPSDFGSSLPASAGTVAPAVGCVGQEAADGGGPERPGDADGELPCLPEGPGYGPGGEEARRQGVQGEAAQDLHDVVIARTIATRKITAPRRLIASLIRWRMATGPRSARGR